MWVSMPELEGVLGRDMARTLARCRGGVDFYVPSLADPGHAIARMVGLRGMEALCAAFGGEWITPPNGRREPQKERVLAMLKQGKPKTAIALECGVTERYVYYLSGMGPQQEQLTLL